MEDLMIKIDNVKKQYRLGAIGGGTLQGDLQTWWAKVRGKEDPNSIIGAKVYKKNEKFMALDGVSFEVKKGERVGIIGHNGAGKSTLLKLLSRVTAPTEGQICLNGRVASMLEVGTGFHGELTGRENIYMNGAILGMTKAEIDAKMEDIIEFSECRQFIDTPVKRYSSGMYVKLAFSVAAHLDSEIMIMDEVLAVGDMAFQKKCLDKMSQVSEAEGRTVLYVSHNMNTIRQLCDRVVVLDHGRVIFDGDVEEGIANYLGYFGVSNSVVDFSKDELHTKGNRDIEIISVKLLDRDRWIFYTGEKIHFDIKVKTKKTIAHVGYRSRITTSDGESVTVLLAPNLLSCEKDKEYTIRLIADISQLVQGSYFFTPVLYGTNKAGGWLFYDHIDQGISFRIENDIGFNENMEWNKKYWGNVKLPEIKKISQIESIV